MDTAEIGMRNVEVSRDTQELARKLFVRLISFEDVDTVAEIEVLMDDSIDLAVEFEMKLKAKRIAVVDRTDEL
jgi:hypothetical protein